MPRIRAAAIALRRSLFVTRSLGSGSRSRACGRPRAFQGVSKSRATEQGSTCEILGRVATKESVDELVERFAWKTKRQAEEIPSAAGPAAAIGLLPPTGEPATPLSLQPQLTAERPDPTARVEPVAKDRWSLRVTLDAEEKRVLDEVRDLLSHKLPDGDLRGVLKEMLRCTIEKHGKRRGTVKPERTGKKPAPPPPTPGKRAPIAASVRREVMERDGHRCAYVSPDGVRCESTWQLELHHRDGALVTGSSGPDELAEPNASGTGATFVPDVVGHYLLGLSVTDATGAVATATAPLEAMICGNQQPVPGTPGQTPLSPTVGDVVTLTLPNLFDPNLSICGPVSMTPYAYRWSLVGAPAGSTATLSSATTAATSLAPDRPPRASPCRWASWGIAARACRSCRA
jgi:hypothetical protein